MMVGLSLPTDLCTLEEQCFRDGKRDAEQDVYSASPAVILARMRDAAVNATDIPYLVEAYLRGFDSQRRRRSSPIAI